MTAPTPEEVSAALAWLAMRGGAFYPSAAGHASVLVRHIDDLQNQIAALILKQDASIQGQG